MAAGPTATQSAGPVDPKEEEELEATAAPAFAPEKLPVAPKEEEEEPRAAALGPERVNSGGKSSSGSRSEENKSSGSSRSEKNKRGSDSKDEGGRQKNAGASTEEPGPSAGWTSFFKKRLDLVASVVITVIVGLLIEMAWKKYLARSNAARAKKMLAECVVPELPKVDLERYVPREAAERRLLDHLDRGEIVSSLLIVGPRGGGKTTIIKKALQARGTVVYVKLTETDDTIDKVLRKKIGLTDGEPFNLADVFGQLPLAGSKNHPVFVLDVDSNVPEHVLKQQSQVLKDLCSDCKLVKGVICLSDAGATFKLCPNPNRQKEIWVGDMSLDEANSYLDKHRVLPTRGEATEASRALRRRFFDEFGALPMMLADAADEVETAAEEAVRELPEVATEADRVEAATEAERRALALFMEKEDKLARAEVNNLLASPKVDKDLKPGLRKLMRALLENPAGVSEEEVDLAALDVCQQVKPRGYHALVFNSETGLFAFASKKHERAARAWFERERAAAAAQRRLRMRWLGTGRFFM